MNVLAITRLRIRSIWLLPIFLYASKQCIKQAKNSPGLIAGKTILDQKLTFWTVSIWQDPTMIDSYNHSGAHAKYRQALSRWTSEARIGHLDTNETELPENEELVVILQRSGKAFRVDKPTTDHLAGTIRPINSRHENLFFP